jgi:hypothetical protein
MNGFKKLEQTIERAINRKRHLLKLINVQLLQQDVSLKRVESQRHSVISISQARHCLAAMPENP